MGKSSLMLRYTDGSFYDNKVTTIGIENKNVIMKMPDKQVNLQSTSDVMQFGTRQDSRNGSMFRPTTFEMSMASLSYTTSRTISRL